MTLSNARGPETCKVPSISAIHTPAIFRRFCCWLGGAGLGTSASPRLGFGASALGVSDVCTGAGARGCWCSWRSREAAWLLCSPASWQLHLRRQFGALAGGFERRSYGREYELAAYTTAARTYYYCAPGLRDRNPASDTHVHHAQPAVTARPSSPSRIPCAATWT